MALMVSGKAVAMTAGAVALRWVPRSGCRCCGQLVSPMILDNAAWPLFVSEWMLLPDESSCCNQITVKRRHTVTPDAPLLFIPEEQCRSHCVWYLTNRIQCIVILFLFVSFSLEMLTCWAEKQYSKKSPETQLFLHFFFLYCGQYWSRLPEWDGNCRQFSVSQLAACFICASPAGRPHALLGVGSFPSAACSTLQDKGCLLH